MKNTTLRARICIFFAIVSLLISNIACVNSDKLTLEGLGKDANCGIYGQTCQNK